MSIGHRDDPWLHWRQFLAFKSFLFDCPKVNNLTGQCFPVTCCTFPKNLETFKNSKSSIYNVLFQNHYKGIQLPNAVGLSEVWKCSLVQKISPSITRGSLSWLVATRDAGRDFFHEWAFSYFRQASGVGKLYSFIVIAEKIIKMRIVDFSRNPNFPAKCNEYLRNWFQWHCTKEKKFLWELKSSRMQIYQRPKDLNGALGVVWTHQKKTTPIWSQGSSDQCDWLQRTKVRVNQH